MTELPPELIEALANKEQAQMKHTWLYSFMPVRNEIYLVGYCKTCDTSVAAYVAIPRQNSSGFYMTDSGYATQISRAHIPKWGCIPPSDL